MRLNKPQKIESPQRIAANQSLRMAPVRKAGCHSQNPNDPMFE